MGIRDGIADKGKVGAVDEGHAIEEEQTGLCHAGRLSLPEEKVKCRL
ncbi:MAG: hypothetical protein ACJAT6_001909 [Akkermansiaceae bacterium]